MDSTVFYMDRRDETIYDFHFIINEPEINLNNLKVRISLYMEFPLDVIKIISINFS